MSTRAVDFVQEWLSENVSADAYDPPRDFIEAEVAQLLAAAQAENITQAEIEEDMGDLYSVVAEAHESATDAEVERLASRDD